MSFLAVAVAELAWIILLTSVRDIIGRSRSERVKNAAIVVALTERQEVNVVAETVERKSVAYSLPGAQLLARF